MGSRVLLADDSVTIQKVVGIIFANEGYDLTVVATGDAAVAKAREIKPDVMLVDALMPGKNGYEVCREIRQDPALAHTAILLMTGAFEVVDEEKSRQSGADEFITKPFESQALIDATNRLVALTAERLANPPQAAAAPVEPPQPPAAPLQAVPAPQVDDIWATGFDDEPAAEPTPLPPAAAAAPADDIWATGFDEAPAADDFFAAAPPPPPAAPAPAPVKAAADDDLWGAFDMDEIEAAPAPFFAETPPPAAAAGDMFGFAPETPVAAPAAAEEEFVLEEMAFNEPSPAGAPTVTGFEPVGEQEIFFAETEPVAVTTAAAVQLPAEDDFGTISFDEPETPAVAPLAPAPPVTPVAAPVFEPAPAPVAPAAQAAAAPAVVAPAALDENQLRTLLASVSREVIEKIVWEIVPDLAETLIKEEIRKLKAGTV